MMTDAVGKSSTVQHRRLCVPLRAVMLYLSFPHRTDIRINYTALSEMLTARSSAS
jgi:hypothetical protein